MGEYKKCIRSKQLFLVALSTALLSTQTVPVFATNTSQSDSKTTALDLMSEAASSNKLEKTKAYEEQDIVTFIVELETEPVLSQKDGARSTISQTEMKTNLLAEHDAIRNKIRAEIAPNQRFATIVSEYDYTTVLNGFTIETAYGNMETISNIEGVKRVFVSGEHKLVKPMIKSSSDMVGADNAWANGYTGKGTKIAILDTGLDLEHEAFQTAPEGAVETKESITALLHNESFLAESMVKGLTADDVYYNEKIPFQFDYFDKDVNVSTEDKAVAKKTLHGTHVAGIVGGYVENTEGAVTFSGIAPDAQLYFMKVSSDHGDSLLDAVIFAALEDAVNLNVDTINMSLGSVAGFTDTKDPVFEAVYKRVSDHGINLMVGAGNSFDSAYKTHTGNDLAKASNPDRGLVNSPSTSPYAISVASIDNLTSKIPSFKIGNREIQYQPAYHHMTCLFYYKNRWGILT